MNKLFLSLLLIFSTQQVMAKTVAWVTEVKGNAFIVAGEHGPKSLRLGSQIEDLSKVMVEDGSALSVINNQGHEFYITSGSYVKFFNGITELINGYVWIISKDDKYTGELNTVNSTVKFTQGQLILSYNNATSKTQVLALDGDVKFANNFESELMIDVPAGFFSFVDANYENSLPRKPTRVGIKSHSQFKKTFASFDHLRDSDIHNRHWAPSVKKPSRSIASVDDQFSVVPKSRGNIIKIKTYERSRTPASISPASISPMEDYSRMKKKARRKYLPQKTKHGVEIKYHGYNWKQVSQKKTVKKTPAKIVIKTNEINQNIKRAPASIQKQSLIQELAPGPKSVFEKSLENNIQREKRHPSEVNGLIDELKSFNQDYNKNY